MRKVPTPADLRTLFFSQVPQAALLDASRCVIGSYAEAYGYSRDNFPGPEAHDLYPILRRSVIERNLRGRLGRFPNLLLEPKRNAQGNCYHTEMVAGRVTLTVSAVEAPAQVVREAVFRNGLAESSQMNLFWQAPPPDPDARLFAILLHGPLGQMLASPQFLHVAFPDREDGYVDRFDLLEYLPVLRDSLGSAPVQPLTERKTPRLRPGKDEKAE